MQMDLTVRWDWEILQFFSYLNFFEDETELPM